MADDGLRRAAERATATAHEKIGAARAATQAARSVFDVGQTVVYFDTVGDKLRKDRQYSARYRDLRAALKDAAAALARAEDACDALANVTRDPGSR